MKQKVHIVTLTDANWGHDPKHIFAFTSREKAVAKMKELYQSELDRMDCDEFYCDFPARPFIPFACCGGVRIVYFETEIQ